MLFVFRGIRGFQVVLSVAAVVAGIAAVLMVKAFSDGGSILLLVPAVVLGLVFLWAFATTLRAPTSFVAVSEERTRIRFAGFVDTVVANGDISAARVVQRRFLGGVGVRTNFSGDVALLSRWGEAAELTLRKPIRVWLVPRLVPLRAHRLTVSVRNPEKLARRFGGASQSPLTRPARKMKHRGPRTR
ncbi:MAG: hypothetical protein ACR2HN_14050 [Tepidiformaceae bacterium]